MSSDAVLRVSGNQIVDGQGQPVVLRGYNVGGWMNMENFLTGYPAPRASTGGPCSARWGRSATSCSSTGS